MAPWVIIFESDMLSIAHLAMVAISSDQFVVYGGECKDRDRNFGYLYNTAQREIKPIAS